MARRIIISLIAIIITLAPFGDLMGVQGPIQTAEASVSAQCCCHDCDAASCEAGTNCAQACVGSSAWIGSASISLVMVATAKTAEPTTEYLLTGLAWPPPLQPPAA
jgi:hypothetical protein